MKFLIACSGSGSRWNNYMSTSKHLVPVEGEILLHRTVRLIKERKKEQDEIYIVVSLDNKQYEIKDTNLIIQKFNNECERHEYYNNPFLYVSKNLWSGSGSGSNGTVIIFGDVYFTSEAMNILFNNIYNKEYMFYGREKGSKITGCSWGEIFAISFLESFNDKLWTDICYLKKLKDNGLVNRFLHWEIYRQLQSLNLNKHVIKKNFIEINDFTDDFDFPEDYDRWIERRDGRP